MKNVLKLPVYLFLALFMAVPLLTQAQSGDSRFGVKGGVNLSNFNRGDVGTQNMRIGFNLGLFTELAVGENFSIQPELLLSTKGNRATYGTNGGVADIVGVDGEVKTNLTYIDIPVLAKVTVGEVLNIHVGPYASYLIGANVSTDGNLGDGVQELDRDNFKTWDYGLAAGLGADIDVVTIGARYNLGLVNVADSDASDLVLDNSKNSVLQFYVAVGF
ncbi:MAG: porin family protein [Tunicatimonas sp.]